MERNYLRMLEGMKKQRGRREWTVYLLRCADGTLYTGIAKNVKERLRKHNAGKGSSYVRSRRPARVVHTEGPLTRSKALMREAKIKGFGKRRKETLVAGPRRRRGKLRAKGVRHRTKGARFANRRSFPPRRRRGRRDEWPQNAQKAQMEWEERPWKRQMG